MFTSKTKVISTICGLVAVGLPAAGCVLDDAELDDDPAGLLGDVPEEWEDDGPLPEDESSDADEAVDFLAAPPRFQLPFRCGQTWAGQTRTNHSPRMSVDFNRVNDYGDAVVAAAAGRVSRVGNTGSTSYGRWIEISHGSGFTTRYAHLSRQRVYVGQRVRQGQLIGNVGSTGGSTGPHLHYEQRHNGVAVRAYFNGSRAYYYGTRNYKSRNSCADNTGAPGRVVTSGLPLTVRTGPGTNYRAVGSLSNGTHVTIRCQKYGQQISGTYGTTRLWDKIGSGYISDAYVYTGSDGRVAPRCN
jgi:hypothetical protein